MKTLHLPLIKKWFDMIQSGDKIEEYREIKGYWASRFLLYQGERKKLCWWKGFLHMKGYEVLKNHLDDISFVKFDSIKFVNGYGSHLPNFFIEVKQLKISTGLNEWGAEDGKYYFTFVLGEKIDSRWFITDPLAGYDN